ncbi:MAG TPA: GFA family protein [Caulobacteraceae bacterium]|nr:GFA family protein [Caulobacteraceae bacterium]
MSDAKSRYAGGCLCGRLRFAADSDPMFQGYCFCADCRKASGSGFVGFMGFAASALRFTGRARQFRSRSWRGGDSVRNFCPMCGGLVFGGVMGESEQHTVYAGALDDPSGFRPSVAIFNRDRPDWAVMPPGLRVFETMPTG